MRAANSSIDSYSISTVGSPVFSVNNPRFHRWRDTQRLMNPAEIIVHGVNFRLKTLLVVTV